MGDGVNVETDLFTRLTYLEAACFANGVNNGTQDPAFQGTIQSPVTSIHGCGLAIAYPGVAILARSGACQAARGDPLVRGRRGTHLDRAAAGHQPQEGSGGNGSLAPR